MVTSTQVRLEENKWSVVNSKLRVNPSFFQLRESVVVSEVNRQAVCGCPQTARICLAKYANIYILPNMQIFTFGQICKYLQMRQLLKLRGQARSPISAVFNLEFSHAWIKPPSQWMKWINMDNMDKHG